MITQLLISYPSGRGNNWQQWLSCYIDTKRRHVLFCMTRMGSCCLQDTFGLAFEYNQDAAELWLARAFPSAQRQRLQGAGKLISNGRTKSSAWYQGFTKRQIGPNEPIEIQPGIPALFCPVKMDFFTGCVIRSTHEERNTRADTLHNAAHLARKLSCRALEWSDGTSLYELRELEMGLFIHHIETIIPSLSASQVVFTGGRSSDSYNQRILDSVKPYYVHDVKTALGITSTAKKAITKSIERHAKRASLDSLAVLRLLAAAQVVTERVKPKMNMAEFLNRQDEQMKQTFGDRVIADSAAALDEQRGQVGQKIPVAPPSGNDTTCADS